MNHIIVKRLAAILAAMTLLATAAACTGNAGEGEGTTTEAVTTTADQSGSGEEDNAGNAWESFIAELEGSETLFQRDEDGNIILPDIPIIPSN